MSILPATYSEDFAVECKACPAGSRCPNNKPPVPCNFSAAVGFYYSTENSKLIVNVVVIKL